MPTFAYQQNVFDGASYGYVKYNISPDFGTPVAADETVTVTGQAYFKNRVNKSLEISTSSSNEMKCAFVNVNIPKATVTDFTLQFPMWALTSSWGSTRVRNAPITFTLWSDTNRGGNGDTTVGVSTQRISYLVYRLSPAARVARFERYALSGSSYVKNDEGTRVMGSLAISLAEGRTVNDITVATAHVTNDAGYSTTITLSSSVLNAALTTNGYVESAPSLFSSVIFGTGYNYTITFTIGDAYDTAVFSVLVARAFANVHLSGCTTGGVAFGKFSASTENHPKFECAYPIVLYGSALYGPLSGIPAYADEGQLYFVVE